MANTKEREKQEGLKSDVSGDELLRRLLHTPPQQRPHRERNQEKPTAIRGKRASAGKRGPSA